MSELSDILKEEYIKYTNQLDLKMLMSMIEEAVGDSLQQSIREESPLPAGDDQDTLEMILKMIPDIEVSEIGWSDVRTPEDAEEIKGPQRKLLEDYLNNIHGTNFEEKIRSVSQFYSSGTQMISEQAAGDRTQRIVQAISYLVFYKTLTKIITNFNASSAGFSFESFLAAMVNGFQITANTGTIADYVDRSSGQDIPVSLKLYKEGNLEVGGSYTDLIRDLVDPKYPQSLDGAMRYVVCTKKLQGEGLEQEGQIDFYQFDFTLDNVMDIITNSKPKSQQCIRLPRQVVSALASGRVDGVNLADRLPGEANLPSDEDLEKEFITHFDKELKKSGIQLSQMQAEELLQALSYGKNDDLFQDWTPKLGDEVVNKGVARGRSKINKPYVKDITKDLEWYSSLTLPTGARLRSDALATLVVRANNEVIAGQSKTRQADARANEIGRMVTEGEFLEPEESARQYKMLGRRQKRVALLNSWGYLTRGHFSLNQNQATSQSAPTNTKALGSIMVGRAMVGEVVSSIRDILNEEVAEIFQSLKILSDSLNQFFAGGLENDSLATAATSNAENISSKEILQSDK